MFSMEEVNASQGSRKCLRTLVSLEPQLSGCDYISQLQDDILILILDKLSIKDAWNTCFLSKTWRNFWSTRVKLTIKSTELEVFPSCLTSLEELYLEGVQLAPDTVSKITTNCLSLAVLSLSNCNHNSNLSINISEKCRLRKLIIDEEIGQVDRNTVLYLNAARIRIIEFASALPRMTYQVEETTFADEVHFSLNQMSNKHRAAKADIGGLLGQQFTMGFIYLFCAFKSSNVLSLSSWCIQTLGSEIVLDNNRRIHRSFASHLKLDMCLRKPELVGVIYLLRACRGLDRISISVTEPEEFHLHDGLRKAFMFRSQFGMADPEDDKSFTDPVVLPHLESVEITINSPRFHYEMWGSDTLCFDEARFLKGTEGGLTALSLLKAKARNLRKILFASRLGRCEIGLQNSDAKWITPLVSTRK